MWARVRPRLTFANVIAVLAQFIALGGGSYAALQVPKGSVGTKQLKRNAVTSPKVKPGSPAAQRLQRVAAQRAARPSRAAGTHRRTRCRGPARRDWPRGSHGPARRDRSGGPARPDRPGGSAGPEVLGGSARGGRH